MECVLAASSASETAFSLLVSPWITAASRHCRCTAVYLRTETTRPSSSPMLIV